MINVVDSFLIPVVVGEYEMVVDVDNSVAKQGNVIDDEVGKRVVVDVSLVIIGFGQSEELCFRGFPSG